MEEWRVTWYKCRICDGGESDVMTSPKSRWLSKPNRGNADGSLAYRTIATISCWVGGVELPMPKPPATAHDGSREDSIEIESQYGPGVSHWFAEAMNYTRLGGLSNLYYTSGIKIYQSLDSSCVNVGPRCIFMTWKWITKLTQSKSQERWRVE